MTSPYAFYQYWFNVEDASVIQLLKVFTDRTRRRSPNWSALAEQPGTCAEAQRALAEAVTTLVHGAGAAAG